MHNYFNRLANILNSPPFVIVHIRKEGSNAHHSKRSRGAARSH
jgi:hypothetical protein